MALRDFLQAYREVICAGEGAQAIQNSLRRIERHARISDHLGYVRTTIIPSANRVGLTGLGLTPSEAEMVFLLFKPARDRLRRDEQTELNQQLTINANRDLLRYLRRYLKRDTKIGELLDVSNMEVQVRPYLNHLARELVVFCYVRDTYGELPLSIEQTPAHTDANEELVDEQDYLTWVSVLTHLFQRARSDLNAKPVREKQLLTDVTTRIAELPRQGELDVLEVLPAFLSAFEAPTESRGHKTLQEQLVLQFCLTATSYLWYFEPTVRAALETDSTNERRKRLFAFLTPDRFLSQGDADLGDRLNWLVKLESKDELLGDSFRRGFAKFIKSYALQSFAVASSSLDDAQALLNQLNDVALPEFELESAGLSKILLVDSNTKVIDDLRQAVAEDLIGLADEAERYGNLDEICANDLPIMPEFLETCEILHALKVKLAQWTEAEEGVSPDSAGEVRAKIKKYFVTMRRSHTGKNARYTQKPESWCDTTAKLFEDYSDTSSLTRVWMRLGGRPNCYFLVNAKQAMQDIGPMLEGFPVQGENP